MEISTRFNDPESGGYNHYGPLLSMDRIVCSSVCTMGGRGMGRLELTSVVGMTIYLLNISFSLSI